MKQAFCTAIPFILIKRTLKQVRSLNLFRLLLVLFLTCLCLSFFVSLDSNPAYVRNESIDRLLNDFNLNLTNYPILQPLHVCAHRPNSPFVVLNVNSIAKFTNASTTKVYFNHSTSDRKRKLSFEAQTLAFVFSSARQFKLRQSVRQTWAMYAKHEAQVRTLFILGRPSTIDEWNQLQVEQNQYQDLLIFAFVDSYYTLVLKSIALLRWTMRNCPQISNVIKVDNDVLINWNLLKQTLIDLHRTNRKEPTVLGQVRAAERPIRNPKSRWYLSEQYFPETQFPPFVAGPMYVLNRPAVKQMIANLHKIKPIYLEDVYITGLLRKQLPDSQVIELRPHLIDFLFSSCYYRRFHAVHRCSASTFINQWQYFKSNDSLLCSPLREFLVTKFHFFM
jgi:beta-1,3-galactosyltransferase 1